MLQDELQRVKRLQNRIDLAIADLEGATIPGISLLDRVVNAAFTILFSPPNIV